MLKLDQDPELTKLVSFINDFLEIGDLTKAQGYVKYLLEDLKILTLLKMTKEDKEDYKPNRTNYGSEKMKKVI